MSNPTLALLNLFNAVYVEEKVEHALEYKTFQRMFENGYVIEPNVKITELLLRNIERVFGIGGNKLNSSFHKSWEKVANTSMYQLVLEQVFHYLTTYGAEAFGVYEESNVYIPHEVLDVPEITEDVPLVLIRCLTPDEILEKIVVLGSSGVALSEDTLSSIMLIVEDIGFDDTSYVSLIKNRELKTRLSDFYGIVPQVPVEYLRWLVMKLTGESLLIKNSYLIGKIKEADGSTLDDLLEYAPEDLSSIFLRYKPLFLAMKSIASNRNKTFFNRLRRNAVYSHVPITMDYISSVTEKIKLREFDPNTLVESLDYATIWRKTRLAYALQNRLSGIKSIIYRVRNGRAWVTEFNDKVYTRDLNTALRLTLESIAEDIRENVNGMVFYIPDYVRYALPSSEKQFVGNVPANTSVSVSDNVVVGIHWYNNESHRIDIDYSLIDATGKYGWDASYRDSERGVLFSGDMTDASGENGASEMFYIRGGFTSPKLFMANYFNFDPSQPVENCQLFVSNTTVVKSDFEGGRRNSGNYMVDPNSILISQNVTIDKKQNVIGLIANVDDENRVYFFTSGVGNSITSGNGEREGQIRDFLLKTCTNAIDLREALEMAGATVVDEIPDYGEYVDLSPQALDKTTILDLFS